VIGPHPPLRGTFSRGEKGDRIPLPLGEGGRRPGEGGNARVIGPHPPLRGTFSRGEKGNPVGREKAENKEYRRGRRQKDGGRKRGAEGLGTAASLLMGTRARDGGGRQNRGKTGLTTQENECEKGKLRLRENRRSEQTEKGNDQSRPARSRIAWRSTKIDEPGLGCWMSQGQGLANAHAQSPQILGAKAGIIDPAGVLGAAGLGRPA